MEPDRIQDAIIILTVCKIHIRVSECVFYNYDNM